MYLPRLADRELADRLAASGAVLIEGPRASGKTETARQQAASEVLLDIDDNARQTIAIEPGLVLAGATPRLIDEWQLEPAIWNHVRRSVDDRRPRGQFILTGSSVPADDITRHTGAGRISRLRLRTMSSFETGLSSGKVSLDGLLAGAFVGCQAPDIGLAALAANICRGGWPGDGAISGGARGGCPRQEAGLSDDAWLGSRIDYLDEIRRGDIVRVDGVSRDPENVGRVLRSLAHHVSTPVSARAIAADAGGNGHSLDPDTVRSYLAALRRLMVYEEQPAWSPHLRSRSALRKSPKRHFVDPSLAAAALGATPSRLLADLPFLGLLFESLAYRDLAIYARACGAEVFHYRDNTNLEVDVVVQNRQGDWCAFEVKLGARQVDAAAATLSRFRDRIDLKRTGAPKALGVIVSSGYAYRRADGVVVAPITALGP